MIVSFGDRATEDLYHNRPTSRARRFPQDVVGLALVKLDMLNGSAGGARPSLAARQSARGPQG